jgi:hypothetical protein
MPKDKKRNIQSYQLQGGNLNEFEFHQRQGEMAEESKPPFLVETNRPDVTQPKRVAEKIAEAPKKRLPGRQRGGTKSQDRQGAAAANTSAKKAPRKSAKKTSITSGGKKRPSVKSRRQKLTASRLS